MELFIIIVLLVIAAETSYLTYITNRKNHIVGQTPMFVDTSVLIDGRIVAVAESGFLTRPLYIPRSVVGELQFLADNADSEKRSRARHGLDVINVLQSISKVRVVIFNDGVKAEEGVDNRLLSLAKKHGGAVCTIDYNLNKVAVVEGIEVLNVNDLAKTLRMAYLPGEKTLLELTQKGNDPHQGVGHLPDGTMVVVEHANKHIGSAVEVEFIRSLQTAAGKMMFAKLTKPAQAATQKPSQPTASKQKTVRQKPQGRSQALQVASEHPKPADAPVVSEKPVRTPRTADRPQRQPRPVRNSEAPQTNTQTPKPTQPAQQRKNGRNARRRSPEDSMVELANSQE